MMKEVMDARIGRYLAGEADLLEREALEREMDSDPAVRERFNLLARIWNTDHPVSETNWDTDSAWSRFQQERQNQPLKIRSKSKMLSWAVAAALVLAFGAAVFLWLDDRTVQYAFDPDQKGPVVLSDDTKIFLNEGATVNVHSLKGKKRIVDLSGEAYFEVVSNPDKPFIVHAGNTVTEVVGTQFNIHQAERQTTIFVREGKVIFRDIRSPKDALALASGEAAIHTDNQIRRIVNPSPNMHAWHSRELSFARHMSFGDIIHDISSYFGKEIVFENDQVKKCHVTIPLAFKDPKFDTIVSAVVASVGAKYLIEGQKCIIRGGENCY